MYTPARPNPAITRRSDALRTSCAANANPRLAIAVTSAPTAMTREGRTRSVSALRRDEAAFRISYPPRPTRWGADLLQSVPRDDRSRAVRENPWHPRANPHLGTGSRGVAPQSQERKAVHRLRACLSAGGNAMGPPARRSQAWRNQHRPQGPLA